jgi:hypothetical protein
VKKSRLSEQWRRLVYFPGSLVDHWRVARLGRKLETGKYGAPLSSGGAWGRTEKTSCPECKGHYSHAPRCRYREVPMSLINDSRGTSREVRAYIDEYLRSR